MSRSFLVLIPLAALAFGCASGNSAAPRNAAAPVAPPVAVTNVTSGLPGAATAHAATDPSADDDDCLDPSDLCFWSQGIVEHAAERERAEQDAQARARAASEQSKAAKRLREAKR